MVRSSASINLFSSFDCDGEMANATIWDSDPSYEGLILFINVHESSFHALRNYTQWIHIMLMCKWFSYSRYCCTLLHSLQGFFFRMQTRFYSWKTCLSSFLVIQKLGRVCCSKSWLLRDSCSGRIGFNVWLRFLNKESPHLVYANK